MGTWTHCVGYDSDMEQSSPGPVTSEKGFFLTDPGSYGARDLNLKGQLRTHTTDPAFVHFSRRSESFELGGKLSPRRSGLTAKVQASSMKHLPSCWYALGPKCMWLFLYLDLEP